MCAFRKVTKKVEVAADESLSDFLLSEENSSDKIRQFLSSVGIVSATKYPQSTGIPPPAKAPEPTPKRVAFLVDYSGSMASTDGSSTRRIDAAIDCVVDFFDKYIDDGFDSVQFSLFNGALSSPIVPMSIKSAAQRQKINNQRSPDGGTSLYTAISGILDAFTAVSYSPVNDWVIALTDGDTADHNQRDTCLRKVRSSKVNLFLIAFGRDAREKDKPVFKTLEQIRDTSLAGGNNSHCEVAEDKAKLAAVFDQIVQLMDSPILSS